MTDPVSFTVRLTDAEASRLDRLRAQCLDAWGFRPSRNDIVKMALKNLDETADFSMECP